MAFRYRSTLRESAPPKIIRVHPRNPRFNISFPLRPPELPLKPLAECAREESNLHEFPHTVLSRTRLPFRHVRFAEPGD